ncbi:LEAF RUST 10 DISEASE-RESISTANCE LOCUS RECEPTOR-LIKE PROTEIN KINASE-like 1.1 [Glycine max]|nr:LEAF RUST 10 DISEASE-RESISTANCE LOCUS RECEPTOR-LIKE PROTEIN KINASE-like 1.1 [Glycine max]KAH1193417.1 LEAF RUST 10 DISEASE-RESISTANCE LOCUS RECEPTOR-LIKE PROTEIN KINASE-like 1.1 [Glycine max]
MQSQGLTLPPEPLVGPSVPRVSTKESCVDPSGNDAETGDSDRCDLYIEAIPAHLVALGRVYEGSTIVHNTPLFPGQVKVGVDEVKDPDALVPVPTDEVSLVGQAIHTFLAWPTHLVKSLSQQADVSPAKPPQKLDPEVDDPLYLMTLTIPELFLRPYQVTWDATVFGIFNPDFPLYIKHEDLSKIAHGGQCLSISVLQLWILYLTEISMRAGNSYLYGFLEPQSIQRFRQSQFEIESYIKSWMQSSKHDVYLGAYLNGEHWQMVVIAPKEHLVVWFCSLHNRPDNYLKGIINSALKGLDDAPQPKSKAPARWIVIKYFNDPRPLESERLKALRIQWTLHLHGELAKPGLLTWSLRMKIAVETASALAYLHASKIIHRDIKTNNILLDNSFYVKVADFGLSRLFPNDMTHVSTAPQGTPGYVDPEYHQCYQLTSKSDVYSFGVVLIELISSMPAVDMNRHKDEINLSNLAIKKIQERALSELVDPYLGFDSDTEVKRMIIEATELAFQCLQQDRELRPSMDEVLEVLKRIESGKDELKHLEEAVHGSGVSHNNNVTTSTELDEAGLLKNRKPPSSPISVPDSRESKSTTPNASS